MRIHHCMGQLCHAGIFLNIQFKHPMALEGQRMRQKKGLHFVEGGVDVFAETKLLPVHCSLSVPFFCCLASHGIKADVIMLLGPSRFLVSSHFWVWWMASAQCDQGLGTWLYSSKPQAGWCPGAGQPGAPIPLWGHGWGGPLWTLSLGTVVQEASSLMSLLIY